MYIFYEYVCHFGIQSMAPWSCEDLSLSFESQEQFPKFPDLSERITLTVKSHITRTVKVWRRWERGSLGTNIPHSAQPSFKFSVRLVKDIMLHFILGLWGHNLRRMIERSTCVFLKALIQNDCIFITLPLSWQGAGNFPTWKRGGRGMLAPRSGHLFLLGHGRRRKKTVSRVQTGWALAPPPTASDILHHRPNYRRAKTHFSSGGVLVYMHPPLSKLNNQLLPVRTVRESSQHPGHGQG